MLWAGSGYGTREILSAPPVLPENGGEEVAHGSGRIFQKAAAIDGVELNLSERVLGDRYKYCPNADQSDTGPTHRRQPFTKNDGSNQSNEDNAEFVYWSDL